VRVTALDALTYAGDEANLDPARDRVELVNATSPTPSWSTGWSPTPTRSCNVAAREKWLRPERRALA
jgi:hypothetical protein